MIYTIVVTYQENNKDIKWNIIVVILTYNEVIKNMLLTGGTCYNLLHYKTNRRNQPA